MVRSCKHCWISCRVLNKGDMLTSLDRSWSLRQGAVLGRCTGEDRIISLGCLTCSWKCSKPLYRFVPYLGHGEALLLWSYSLMKTVDDILQRTLSLPNNSNIRGKQNKCHCNTCVKHMLVSPGCVSPACCSHSLAL